MSETERIEGQIIRIRGQIFQGLLSGKFGDATGLTVKNFRVNINRMGLFICGQGNSHSRNQERYFDEDGNDITEADRPVREKAGTVGKAFVDALQCTDLDYDQNMKVFYYADLDALYEVVKNLAR